eukprot:651965-Pleurochrysis_carterae.AAC.2
MGPSTTYVAAHTEMRRACDANLTPDHDSTRAQRALTSRFECATPQRRTARRTAFDHCLCVTLHLTSRLLHAAGEPAASQPRPAATAELVGMGERRAASERHRAGEARRPRRGGLCALLADAAAAVQRLWRHRWRRPGGHLPHVLVPQRRDLRRHTGALVARQHAGVGRHALLRRHDGALDARRVDALVAHLLLSPPLLAPRDQAAAAVHGRRARRERTRAAGHRRRPCRRAAGGGAEHARAGRGAVGGALRRRRGGGQAGARHGQAQKAARQADQPDVAHRRGGGGAGQHAQALLRRVRLGLRWLRAADVALRRQHLPLASPAP